MKPKISVHEFAYLVRVADVQFDEGRFKKSFRTLRKALIKFDEDIPAYLYIKYIDLWHEFEKDYDVFYHVKAMSDEELNIRMTEAIAKDRVSRKQSDIRFQDGVKTALNNYMGDFISLKDWYNRMRNLEQKYIESNYYSEEFMREILTVFRAYFYERRKIKQSVISLYHKYLINSFECKTFEQLYRSRIDEVVEKSLTDLPEPIICVVDVEKNQILDSFFMDPTIPDVDDLKESASMDEKRMSIFRCALHFDPQMFKDKNPNMWFVTNWYEMKEKYPEFATVFIEMGKKYCTKRSDKKREEYLKKMHELENMKLSKRKQIVSVYNHYDDIWLKVAE